MSDATNVEMDAAKNANNDLGDIKVGGGHLLGTEAGKKILDTYEKAEESIRDSLTGLYNRRFFDKTIEEKINESSPFSLVLIDLDNFKKINDEYGHPTGDATLINLARVLSERLRLTRSEESRDVIARIGGEEFAVILSGVDSENDAAKIADELRDNFARSKFIAGNGTEITATFSAGVSVAGAGETSADLFSRADKALYAAKAGGKNKVISLKEENVI